MRTLNEKLIAAIYHGKERKLLALLKKGADVNFYDDVDTTPLMHAVSVEKLNCNIVDLLIKHGADVNARDPVKKWTVFMDTTRFGL